MATLDIDKALDIYEKGHRERAAFIVAIAATEAAERQAAALERIAAALERADNLSKMFGGEA